MMLSRTYIDDKYIVKNEDIMVKVKHIHIDSMLANPLSKNLIPKAYEIHVINLDNSFDMLDWWEFNKLY